MDNENGKEHGLGEIEHDPHSHTHTSPRDRSRGKHERIGVGTRIG
jgi:hypothetical protein